MRFCQETVGLRLKSISRLDFESGLKKVKNEVHIIRDSGDDAPLVYVTGLGGSQYAPLIQETFRIRYSGKRTTDKVIRIQRSILCVTHYTVDCMLQPLSCTQRVVSGTCKHALPHQVPLYPLRRTQTISESACLIVAFNYVLRHLPVQELCHEHDVTAAKVLRDVLTKSYDAAVAYDGLAPVLPTASYCSDRKRSFDETQRRHVLFLLGIKTVKR